MKRIGLIVMLLGLLLACTPSYNWREVTVADGAVKAFFPDRPLVQQRTLNYSGHDLQFTLATATVEGAVFAVGHAPLPESLQSTPQQTREFALSVVASLYRSVGATAPSELPKDGVPFVIDGVSEKGSVRMKAIIWLTKHALVEGIVTADQSAFPVQQTEQFLHSLEVTQ